MIAFDPSDNEQNRFRGYGPSKLPNSLDDQVSAFVAGIISGGTAAVADGCAKLSERGKQVLRAFAERAAALAVRTGSRDILISATVANVLGGLDEYRLESLVAMAPIDDASLRLGIELSDLFEDVAHIVGHPATANLMRWMRREAGDRSLSSMGFVVQQEPDGIRYRLDW